MDIMDIIMESFIQHIHLFPSLEIIVIRDIVRTPFRDVDMGQASNRSGLTTNHNGHRIATQPCGYNFFLYDVYLHIFTLKITG